MNTDSEQLNSGFNLKAWLLTPEAIRENCALVYNAGLNGDLKYFDIDLERLISVTNYVKNITLKRYPNLKIPMHSRWRHFSLGKDNRWERIVNKFQLSGEEKTRVAFDLAITSVIIDAGAGDNWRYHDSETNRMLSRSEGLAIASINAFENGLFSGDSRRPLCADQNGLLKVTEKKFSKFFQVNKQNSLLGVEGRVKLINGLGLSLGKNSNIFRGEFNRLGNLFDYLKRNSSQGKLKASKIFTSILESLGGIWPERCAMGFNLGDIWRHPAAIKNHNIEGFVPFHKLSQWLTYSLIEPVIEAGIDVIDVHELTSLAEYRNGGLLIDFGVLIPKCNEIIENTHKPSDEVIVEWRALTVSLMDILAKKLRETFDLNQDTLPMVNILEGGTWAAGRAIAFAKRPDGSPPIKIFSDASVF